MTSPNPTNGAAADLPLYDGPVTTVLIAHTPRTGSTLLATGLGATGLCGRPHEYFNFLHMDEIRGRVGPLSLPDYVRWLKRHRTTENGIFCVKASPFQLSREMLERGHNPRMQLSPLRCVWIQRRDKVRQAVSYIRAMQTDRWRADTKEVRPAHYDFDLIERSLNFLIRQNEMWPQLFTLLGVSPIPVSYLQLANHYSATVRGLGAALGLGPADRLKVGPPRRQRMPTEESLEWANRFRAQARERGLDLRRLGPEEPTP